MTRTPGTGSAGRPGDPPRGSAPGRRRGLWFALGGLAAVAVGVFAVWYLVFRDTAPPAVDIDRAAESVDRGSSGTSGAGADGLDGTWTIDDSVGDFNVATNTFTSVFVGYRVNEQLAGTGAKTAYGRTPEVTGSLTISGTQATKATFTADLTGLQSDDGGRDGQLANQAIQTARFPKATFTLTQPIDFAKVPTDDQTVKVNATGNLTLHGVTKSVTIPLDTKLVGDTIVVTSLFEIKFADYDISKPTSFKVLSIDDHGLMEVQLFFVRS